MIVRQIDHGDGSLTIQVGQRKTRLQTGREADAFLMGVRVAQEHSRRRLQRAAQRFTTTDVVWSQADNRPAERDEVLEEAAKVAEAEPTDGHWSMRAARHQVGQTIAAAIRALKTDNTCSREDHK
jgi:hypothetical protein